MSLEICVICDASRNSTWVNFYRDDFDNWFCGTHWNIYQDYMKLKSEEFIKSERLNYCKD